MEYTYSKFFEILSRELNQALEYADSNSDYQYINEEDLYVVLNETIQGLVDSVPLRFQKEYVHKFSGETSVLTIPEIFHRILGYYEPRIGQFRLFYDASDMITDFRVTGNDTIYANATPWQKGDEIRLLVSEWPPEVTSTSDAVPFPKQFMRYLRLEIMRKVLGARGKEWSMLTQSEYVDERSRFATTTPAVQRTLKLKNSGARFGR